MHLPPTLPLLLVTLEKKLSTHKPNKKNSVLTIFLVHMSQVETSPHTLSNFFPDQSKKKILARMARMAHTVALRFSSDDG